jgi:ribosomal protein L37AE/L43A
MKITIKPKTVKVTWNKIEYVTYRSQYQCPKCRVEYHNTLDKRVTRFKCDCGQELIVN